MKIVIGIILVAVLMAALILYIMLVLNSQDLVFCGDIPQEQGQQMYVTRVYTADLNANQTLSEIVNKMNAAENGSISAEDLTEILASYQNITYAPVFTFNLQQADDNTFVLEGSVFNGLKDTGEPETTDYLYKNMTLTAGVANGRMLAVQNVYSEDVDENGEPAFKERRKVVDPVVFNDDKSAAFAFRDCDSFRIVFTNAENTPASITLAYTYEVTAVNPLNFTSLHNGVMGVTITAEYDDRGQLTPSINMERVYTYNGE